MQKHCALQDSRALLHCDLRSEGKWVSQGDGTVSFCGRLKHGTGLSVMHHGRALDGRDDNREADGIDELITESGRHLNKAGKMPSL
jgi:hypothetical protein